jgi:hypothetical protein
MCKSHPNTLDRARQAGLRCWRCQHRHFRVSYTRAARDGISIRRSEYHQCRPRITHLGTRNRRLRQHHHAFAAHAARFRAREQRFTSRR